MDRVAGLDAEGWDLPPWTTSTFNLQKELDVNARLNLSDLRKLRSWASKRKNIPKVDDADLVKFLHSSDYNIKEAQKCMEAYYGVRSCTPELFSNRDITSEKLEAQLQVTDCIALPKTTPDGCRVVLTRLKEGEPSRYVFADHQKIMLMIMDACLLAEPTAPSFYFMYDLNLGQMSHFWRFGFWLQRKLYSYFETGLPLRLRGVILVHVPPFISSVMKFLNAIVSKQRLETTVLLLGDDYTLLYELIPRECLPSDYGGCLPSAETLHDMTVERLHGLCEYFKDEEDRTAGIKK